jgi:hypothetical protein
MAKTDKITEVKVPKNKKLRLILDQKTLLTKLTTILVLVDLQ